MNVLGIDIGGSGVKGAPVDLVRGQFATDRLRIDTPHPSTPEAVAEVVKEIADHFDLKGPFGCTFPAVVQHGVTLSAANVDKSWIGAHAADLFREVTDYPVCVLNDADAAGIAEMTFGAGQGRMGVVIMLTFGTGIGSAIFTDGRLVPNTEFGHVEFNGHEAEAYASNRARKDKDLSWKKWSKRVDKYLHYMEMLFSPDLFIIGGGVSKKYHKFIPRLSVRAEVVPAQLRNDAGIIGAALQAHEMFD